MSLFTQLEHLQRECQEFQQEYDLLSESIQCLNYDYLNARYESEKLPFKKRRELAEQEREAIKEKMQPLKLKMARYPLQMVFDQLLSIDYVDHVQRFDEFLEQENCGAFILHGQTKNGLYLLLKRLQQYVSVRNACCSFPIRMNLSALQKLNYCGSSETFNTRLLWKKIGEKLQCGASPETVAAKLCQKHEEQNVLLIFDAMDITCDFQAILDDFWEILIKTIREGSCQSPNALLLLFIVHDDGFWSHEHAVFPGKYDTSWTPSVPVKLPEVASYALHDVENWIQLFCQQFPFYHKHYSPEILHEMFGERNTAYPDFVIKQICTQLCKCEFNEGVLQEWLRI